jgi:hypothetical protein
MHVHTPQPLPLKNSPFPTDHASLSMEYWSRYNCASKHKMALDMANGTSRVIALFYLELQIEGSNRVTVQIINMKSFHRQ